MAQRNETQQQPGRLRRVASAVKSLFGRKESGAASESRASALRARPKEEAHAARPTKREADIPLDVLQQVYTPPMTSSKASFRSDGADRQRDQEFALGVADERWNDEDRLTNKSGDPRIGTHGRTYEPDETRDESRE
jgi:hypothetical protein